MTFFATDSKLFGEVLDLIVDLCQILVLSPIHTGKPVLFNVPPLSWRHTVQLRFASKALPLIKLIICGATKGYSKYYSSSLNPRYSFLQVEQTIS